MIKKLITLLYLVIFSQALASAEELDKKAINMVAGSEVTLDSSILKQQRKVIIYTPASYKNENKKYPVLYLLDGERHIYHAILANKLLQEINLLPEIIIVAINNSENEGARGKDLFHDRKLFAKFIATELFEYVQKNYRVNDDRTLYGHSLAGFFTVDLLATNPSLFKRYIAVGAPLRTDDKRIHKQINAREMTEDKSLYLSMAARMEEGDEDYDAVTNLVNLLKKQAPEKLQWTFERMDDETHISNYYISYFKGIRKVFE